MKHLLFLALLLTGLLFIVSPVQAIWPWDECSAPGASIQANTQYAQGYIGGWYFDDTDWIDVTISRAGTYNAWLTGPSGSDFEVYVYKDCRATTLKCKDIGSGSSKLCEFYASAGTYKMQAFASAGSGQWKMGAYAKQYTTQCFNNDVYWYNYKGGLENKRRECGTDETIADNTLYCSNNAVVKDITTIDRGCNAAQCYEIPTTEPQIIDPCTSNEICTNGSCELQSTTYTQCYNDDLYNYENGQRTTVNDYCEPKITQNTGSKYCSGDSVVQMQNSSGGCNVEINSCNTGSTTKEATILDCNTKDYFGADQFYCTGDTLYKRAKHFDYSCSIGTCVVQSDNYTEGEFVEVCSNGCDNNACIGEQTNVAIKPGSIGVRK